MAKAAGLELQLTEGGSHTKAVMGERRSTIPRHREINEITAKAIIADLSPGQEGPDVREEGH